jgi:hypothetical protein
MVSGSFEYFDSPSKPTPGVSSHPGVGGVLIQSVDRPTGNDVNHFHSRRPNEALHDPLLCYET